METEVKTPSLVWEVCFGAVFKCKHDGRRVLALTERRNNGAWTPPTEIGDPDNVYKSLGVDQCSIVHVLRRDDMVKLLDIFTVTLNEGGDSTTAAKAMQEKILGDLLEKIFKGWLKETGPLLIHAPGDSHDGQPSIIWPTDLLAKYDTEDLAALGKAFAHEMLEGSTAEQKPVIEQAVQKFNNFLAKVEPEDEVYWFEHRAPMADRIGYAILRKGRVFATYIVLMS